MSNRPKIEDVLNAFQASAAGTEKTAPVKEEAELDVDSVDDVIQSIKVEDILSNLNKLPVIRNQQTTRSAKSPLEEKTRVRPFQRKSRGCRMKVFDAGYVFTKDKDSSCGTKSFWRCERKNDCPARVHTDITGGKILKRIHNHTHPAPCVEELPPEMQLIHPNGDRAEPTEAKPNTALFLASANSIANGINSANLSPAGTNASSNSDRLGASVSPDRTSSSPSLVSQASPSNDDANIASETIMQKQFVVDMLHRLQQGMSLEQFAQVFEATKKVIDALGFSKDGYKTHVAAERECDPQVVEFLKQCRLGQYARKFSRYTLSALRELSRADCISILGTTHGILLFNSLHKWYDENTQMLKTDKP